MCVLFLGRIPIMGEKCVKILKKKKKTYRGHTDMQTFTQEMGQRAGKDNAKTGTEPRVVRKKGGRERMCLVLVSPNIPVKAPD